MDCKHKVLIVASVISFIEWFNKENVDYLRETRGCEVHIAVNTDYMEDTDVERTLAYLKQLRNNGVIIHNIHFARSPFSLENIIAYKQLKQIIDSVGFDLIHVHTPTVSILTRLAARHARKNGTVVMYTCHGFHFHNASPKRNWLVYYPIERLMSRYGDYLVTINKEDFKQAKTFHTPNVRYIHGVGVDLKKIQSVQINKAEYKKLLGLPEGTVMLLSVGEMIERKNHEVIIRALAHSGLENVHYVIAGKGPLKGHLQTLANKLGISSLVHFLGFRKDIPELCNATDISAFPSRIEGLGLAGIEAMAAGIPLVSSNVHGILDYVKNGKTGYALNPDDVDGFATAIKRFATNQNLRISMTTACKEAVKPFDLPNALQDMWKIYDEILCKN